MSKEIKPSIWYGNCQQFCHAFYWRLGKSVHFTRNLLYNLFFSLIMNSRCYSQSPRGRWKWINTFLYQWVSGSDRRVKRKDEFKEGRSGLYMRVCMCVAAVTVSQETQRRGRDIMAGRGDEMWPSQGHCTEVIYIYWSQRRFGDTCSEVYRSRSKFQSHSNCYCVL